MSKDPNAAGVINGTFKVGIIQITAKFEKTKYLYNIIYIIIIMLYKVLFFLDSAVFKNNMYIDGTYKILIIKFKARFDFKHIFVIGPI